MSDLGRGTEVAFGAPRSEFDTVWEVGHLKGRPPNTKGLDVAQGMRKANLIKFTLLMEADFVGSWFARKR
jgi:hypothetical protein